MNTSSQTLDTENLTENLPQLTPRRLRCNRYICGICGDANVQISKKHEICFDCLVDTLSSAKIFSQGFDSRPGKVDKICIICLNHSNFIGERNLVCMDCIIKRLGDLKLLNFKDAEAINPIFLALETDYSSQARVDWQRKKYLPCDVCGRDNVDDQRTERLCMDCVLDKILDTPYFIKSRRRVYQI